jgi:hypothetical protein
LRTLPNELVLLSIFPYDEHRADDVLLRSFVQHDVGTFS